MNEEILTQIFQDIETVKKLNNSEDMDSRWRLAERIVTNGYYLAKLKSDSYDELLELEAEYDNQVSFDTTNYEGPATKAKDYAKDKNKELNTKLAKAKGLYRRLDSLLSQSNSVVEQIRQTLSILKNERRNNNY